MKRSVGDWAAAWERRRRSASSLKPSSGWREDSKARDQWSAVTIAVGGKGVVSNWGCVICAFENFGSRQTRVVSQCFIALLGSELQLLDQCPQDNLFRHTCMEAKENANIPPNVAVDVHKNALNGSVNCRKAGYRNPAPYTPSTPNPSPAAPPMLPPFSVSLTHRISDMLHVRSWGKLRRGGVYL